MNDEHMNSAADRAVLDFLTESKVDRTALLKFQHLDPTFIPAPLNKSQCVFCSRYDNATFQLEPLPVGLFPEFLDGGLVRVCHTCSQKVNNYAGSWYAVLNSFCSLARCAKCQNPYHITNVERDSRAAADTTEDHLCPKCTHDSLLGFYDTPGSILNGVGYDEVTNFPWRYSSHKCAHCPGIVCIDHTLKPQAKLDRFVGHDGKLICDYCVLNINGFIQAPLSVATSTDIILRLYSVNDHEYKIIVKQLQRRLLGLTGPSNMTNYRPT